MALIEPQPCQSADKDDVARRFSRAAIDYEQFANIQSQIAVNTLARLAQRGITGESAPRALDIGCGTGRHTAELATLVARAEGLDLASGMIDVARQRFPDISFVQGDAEQLPWSEPVFDVVYSSMALQWCQRPLVAMSELHRVMHSNGLAELAIMVDGSFTELTAASGIVNAGIQLNRLPDTQSWLTAARQAGFTLTSNHVALYTDTFTSLIELLRSIKCVGAGSPTHKNTGLPLTRSRLQALEQAMTNPATGELLNTYKVLQLSLEKP